MPAESVSIAPTPYWLSDASDTLNEDSNPREMANSQSGPSAVLPGPKISQSDNSSVSTQLRSTKDDVQKPPIRSRDFASPSVLVDPAFNEPLTRKRQRQKAATTVPTSEEPQQEQGDDTVRQPSEEIIRGLKDEIQRLKRERSDQQARQSALIKGFVTSAAVIELAVDIREAELRSGLNSIGSTSAGMQDQAQEMIRFSNGTSWHVCRLVQDMLEEQQVFLNDDEQNKLRHEYEYVSAQPSLAVTSILDERLSFIRGRSGA